MAWLDIRYISCVGMFMGESAISLIILFLIYTLAESCDLLLLYIIPSKHGKVIEGRFNQA